MVYFRKPLVNMLTCLCIFKSCPSRMTNFLFFPQESYFPATRNLAVNLDCALFADVMIPESPEAYVKLTESAIRNTSGRQASL